MKLKKYQTKERMYNIRLLNETEYEGFLITKADDIASTEDIVVPHDFAVTHTSHKKIQKAISFYDDNGYLDKPITVIPEINERGKRNKLILVDGLSRYYAALHLHLDIVPVIYIDIEDVEI